MTHYIDDPYIESEYDEIFNEWYEIEGIRKIRELSRQLRTFFNYKAEVIRYRFRSKIFPVKKCKDTNRIIKDILFLEILLEEELMNIGEIIKKLKRSS